MSSPLRLDVKHYETVVAIVDQSSMTEAARHLSITQSAMSHRLAEAERRLGVTLFRRGPDRRLTPTSHGVAVHQAASRALAELGRLEDVIAGRRGSAIATVRLGVGSYEAFHWYPAFMAMVATVRPDIELDLVAVGDDPGSALASRMIDVALVLGDASGVAEMQPAMDDELVFVCAPDHRLADKDRIEPSDLAAETYLTYNALPSPGFEYDRFVRSGSEEPRIVRVVRQSSAIVELVAANAGVSIVSRWATLPAHDAGRLAIARCGDGLPIRWHAGHRVGDPLAADVARLLATHLSG